MLFVSVISPEVELICVPPPLKPEELVVNMLFVRAISPEMVTILAPPPLVTPAGSAELLLNSQFSMLTLPSIRLGKNTTAATVSKVTTELTVLDSHVCRVSLNKKATTLSITNILPFWIVRFLMVISALESSARSCVVSMMSTVLGGSPLSTVAPAPAPTMARGNSLPCCTVYESGFECPRCYVMVSSSPLPAAVSRAPCSSKLFVTVKTAAKLAIGRTKKARMTPLWTAVYIYLYKRA